MLTPTAAGDGAPEPLWAKTGLVVRVGVAVDLEIAPEAAAHARIGWGNPGSPVTRVHVDACTGRSAWLWWPGGYWVDKPICLPLIVRAGRQEQTAYIPIGMVCPR
jgi:hypothetical protein